MSDLVSVIVPVYNVEKYVDACLRSITEQTYHNLEILVVDDGSTDLSGRKCDEWSEKDSRIKVIHQENQGLSDARNAAIDVCSGDWITFIDSDDKVDRRYVEILLNLAKKYEVSIAQCFMKSLEFPAQFQDNVETGVIDSRDFLRSKIGKPMACGKIYKREIFAWARYPSGKIHEDFALTYRLVYEAKRIAYTEQILYFCNARPDSITAHFYKERLVILQIYKEQIEYYRENEDADLEKMAVRSYLYALLENYYKVKMILRDKKIASMIMAEYRKVWKNVWNDREISLKGKCVLIICYLWPSVWGKITDRKEAGKIKG